MSIFDLPLGARPGRDTPVGQDELGRMVYRTATGQQYTMPEPPRMAPRAAGPMQGPLAYASPQRMAEMSAYASDLRGMQGSYSPQDIAAAGYSPMEVAAFTTAGRPAVPFSQEADRDRQRAPADVLQEPDYTMRQEATYMLQDALMQQGGMDAYEAGLYARRIMGDPNAADILDSMGLINIAAMLGGSASLAAKGLGLTGRAIAAAPAALSGLFNVEEGTQTAQRGYQEGSALQTGLGALQAVDGMSEMFPAGKLIAEGIARTASRMDTNTLYSVFGPPIPTQPVRAPDTGAGYGRPPLTFDEVARAMQEAPPASAPKAAPLDVSRRDASNIFGEGSERVRYTDPQSGGTIEVVVRPDGSASVLELEVPEASRGQGIGQTLQERVMQDFPVMGGQVSSKAAATTAYRLGRRPPGKPNATLEEVFADIDEMSSVNMVSPAMQERLAPAAPILPAPRNEAEAMARDILQLRAEGRADEVTEEMMAAADPQYMYFNTPLPMDYESRMARAIQHGFDVNDEMYRGDAPRQAFETGRGQRDQIGVTASSIPDVAASYIPARGEGGIYPLFSRGENDAVISAGGQNWNVILPDTPVRFQGEQSRLDEYIPVSEYFEPYDVAAGTAFFDTNDLSRILQGYGADRVRFNELVDRGASARYYGPQSASPSDVTMVANPANVRSRFARFDPEFRNLSNLSAGVGGAAVLTALGDDAEAGTPETQIMDLVKQSGVSGAAQILGVSRRDIEEAISIAVPPSQWDQLVVGPQ